MASTEIAEVETQRRAPVVAGGKVASFVATTVDEAWRIANIIGKSGMAPKAFGADPSKIMVGIMAGAEVGLTPFAALQSIAVINGNPSLWGDGALAVVQASGLLEDIEETDDGATATCILRRVGRASPIARSFSMDDARRAGLAGKAGPWTQYPARMRQMRARSFALRDGFPDVLKGLQIAEEVRDYSHAPAGDYSNGEQLTGQMLLEQAAPKTLAEELDDEIPYARFEQEKADVGNGDDPDADATPTTDETAEYAPEPQTDQVVSRSDGEAVDSLSMLAANIREQIAAAPNKRGLAAVEGEWVNRYRNDFDDERIAEIERLIADRKRRLA